MIAQAADNNRGGQSMIEVLVAIGIAVVIIIALVQSIVTSIKNSQFAKNQTLATRFSQEAIELVRNVRDRTGWANFYNSFNAKTKCIGSVDYAFWSDISPCPVNTGEIFSRQAVFSDPSGAGNELLVVITTSWSDTTGSHKSEQQTMLTKW